jgi:hypothetical protein
MSEVADVSLLTKQLEYIFELIGEGDDYERIKQQKFEKFQAHVDKGVAKRENS